MRNVKPVSSPGCCVQWLQANSRGHLEPEPSPPRPANPAQPNFPARVHSRQFVTTFCIAVSQCHSRTVMRKKKKKCSMLSMGWAQNAALKQSFSFCSHHKVVMFLKQMSLLHFACSVQRQSYLGKFFKHRFSLLYSRTFLTHQTLTGSLLLWVWLFSYSARRGWKNSSLETLKSLLWQNMHLVYAFYKSAFKQRDAFMIMCKC